jgi:hypothetical protein
VYREGEPAAIRGAELGELFRPEEIFAWIQQVHPRSRVGTAGAKLDALKREWGISVDEEPAPGVPDPGRPAEIYARGAMILEPGPFLPAVGQDFDEWIRATHEQLGVEFGMQAPGIECASWEALGRLQALLGPVLAETGPRTYRYNAFLGDYRATPFGYHVDPHQEAVFQVVLSGRRVARFWDGLRLRAEDAAWVEDSNGLEPPPRPPQVELELEPGDVVFWPGTHVHGFEPEGPSMALSMVIDRQSPRTRAELIRELEVATAGGLPSLPLVDEQAFVTPDDTLVRRSRFPLRWARHEDALLVAACGRHFQWPSLGSIPQATRLFAALEASERVVVAELIERFADEILLPEDIGEALMLLAAWGFFVPE